MAKGSEQFAWRLYPGVERRCWECEKPLKIKDVAEVRTTYPPKYRFATRFRCVDCFGLVIERLVNGTGS